MALQRVRSINVWRGIYGATVAGMLASMIPLVIPLGLLIIGHDTTREFGYDLRVEPWRLSDAMVAITVFFAYAGWASYAPERAFRFTHGLARIFLLSACAWLIAWLGGLAPVRYKSLSDFEYYSRVVAFILGPPVVATVAMTWMRARAVSQKHAESVAGSNGR